MKAYYYGDDTYGKHIEVATNDGVSYFYRVYQFNGYGMAWGKWQAIDHHERDLFTNSWGDSCYKWGFNELKKMGTHNFKLPA